MHHSVTKLGIIVFLAVELTTPAQDAKKPGAPKVDQAKVDEAIKRGLEFLKVANPPPTEPWLHTQNHLLRKTEIVLWAYLKAGLAPGDDRVKALFKDMMERPLDATYEVAFQALILEDLDRAKYQWRLHQCAQFLVDNQCADGGWGYGDPSTAANSLPGGDTSLDAAGPVRPKPKIAKKLTVKRTREGERPDNSNSAYAAFALRSCAESGIVIPPETIALAEKRWRKTHKGPGQGWCYSDHSDHQCYGSMTANGLGSLAIFGSLRGAKKTWKADPQQLSAIQWL